MAEGGNPSPKQHKQHKQHKQTQVAASIERISLAGPIGTDHQAATSSRKCIDKAAVGGRLSGASPSALAHDHMGRFASVATWATGRFGPAEHIPPSLFKDDTTGKPRAFRTQPTKTATPRARAPGIGGSATHAQTARLLEVHAHGHQGHAKARAPALIVIA